MEPRARAAEAVTEPARSTRFRLRLAAALCAADRARASIQAPGLLVADTKFDLAVDPGGSWRARCTCGTPQGAFGQLQNQAYGYLWPMGPFFALGGIGPASRAGWSSGCGWRWSCASPSSARPGWPARSASRSDLACIVGGFAYALSPRMLTTLGPISIEAWPSALAPVGAAAAGASARRRGSPRRAAALSALAVAMVGGVNAAATFAVLPLGVVWLLTRDAAARRRTSLMLWWPVFTAARPPCGGWCRCSCSAPTARRSSTSSRSAATTTFPTTLFDALRGTSNWVAVPRHRRRGPGNDLLARPDPDRSTAASSLLLGLARHPAPRATRDRLFLAARRAGRAADGHGGPHRRGARAGSPRTLQRRARRRAGAAAQRAQVRPVIRLPLVLGLAWTVDRLLARLRSGGPSAGATAPTAAMRRLQRVAVLVHGGRRGRRRRDPGPRRPDHADRRLHGVPDYWPQTADWLGATGRRRPRCCVPGSSFGDYVWGIPQDEPIQSLGRSPWAVRNAIPLDPAGQHPDARRDRGAARPGRRLGRAWRRTCAGPGSRYLVVRNDLDRAADVPDPVLVHQALAQSPGTRPGRRRSARTSAAARHIDSDDGPRIAGQRRLAGRVPRGRGLRRDRRRPAARRGQPGRPGRGRRARGPARPDRRSASSATSRPCWPSTSDGTTRPTRP